MDLILDHTQTFTVAKWTFSLLRMSSQGRGGSVYYFR